MYISEAVISEVHAGDKETAGHRLSLIESLRILSLTGEVEHLVRGYQADLALPETA